MKLLVFTCTEVSIPAQSGPFSQTHAQVAAVVGTGVCVSDLTVPRGGVGPLLALQDVTWTGIQKVVNET